ncbi:bacterial low temperature requirement A protein-domain-containing protein [Rhexocercosporidium sp. MPI-PUGE-AT-0058]|nr:bacterial low temperature requirement A protein-domain-containing protein [Rhexocercosporidium sp. MPI-PUGE-AT-0058]
MTNMPEEKYSKLPFEQAPASAMNDARSSKAQDIFHRRKAERMPFVSPPVIFDEKGGFKYHHHEDATIIELFYDLFFVANLSNLTNYSKISDRASLTQYIGWFSIIWATWFQVSMFDVRFGSDSLIYRLFKVIQFCVMIALAAESSNFAPERFNLGDSKTIDSFRIIDCILLISRAALICEYLIPLLYMLKKRQRRVTKLFLPLLLCCLTFFISALIYASILPTFSESGYGQHAYRAWYIILGFEVISILAISSIWRVVSFKHTHVVKRMGLLTIIILGEGVLNAARELSNTARNSGWTRDAFGQALVASLVIYMIWDLYFGKIPDEHFGTLKQQVYTMLHYPFHLALALVLEGQVVWTQIANVGARAVRLFAPATAILISNDSAAVQVQKLNETFYSILNDIKYKNFFPLQEIQDSFNATYTAVLAQNDTSISSTLDSVVTLIYNGLLADAGIQINDKTTREIANTSTQRGNRTVGTLTSDAYSQLFGVSFIYYLVTAGIALIMLGVFRWLVLLRKDVFDRLAIGIRMLLGLLLCMLSLLVVQRRGDLVNKYTGSGWFLATFLLALGVVGLFDRILDQLGIWKYQGRPQFSKMFRRRRAMVQSTTE